MSQVELFTATDLEPIEQQVLRGINRLRSDLGYAIRNPQRWYGLLRRNALARNIRGSNSIEGYNVSVEDAMAAVEGEEPLEATERDWAAISGYQAAMTYVLQLADDPHFSYSTDLLRSLHYMMISYDLSKNPGTWRAKPISIVDSQSGDAVYEAPDAERVPELMDRLVRFLNDGRVATSDLIKAAMAHLNLVFIHPFSDGNGRMARCLQSLVLARAGILAPPFSSIEEYLGHGKNTLDYYQTLASVGGGSWQPERNTKDWIRFCLKAHHIQAKTHLERLKEMHRVWDMCEQEIERRGLPDRMTSAVAESALGYKVRNPVYRSTAEISMALASRDLKRLVEEGLLAPRGERRGRYYKASEELRQRRQEIPPRPPIADPFEELQKLLPFEADSQI